MLLAGAVIAAAADWWAVHRDRPFVEIAAKPLVLLFLAGAVALDASSVTQWAVVVALVLSLIGDVLLLPAIDRFVGGLAAFLAAHVAFIVAFAAEITAGPVGERWQLIAGVVLAIAFWVVVGRRIIAASAGRDPVLGRAVTSYVGALTLMVMLGVGVGAPLAAIGATVFAVSDAVLGWNRFVAPIESGRLLTHIPYHVGQGLLALWAIGLS